MLVRRSVPPRRVLGLGARLLVIVAMLGGLLAVPAEGQTVANEVLLPNTKLIHQVKNSAAGQPCDPVGIDNWRYRVITENQKELWYVDSCSFAEQATRNEFQLGVASVGASVICNILGVTVVLGIACDQAYNGSASVFAPDWTALALECGPRATGYLMEVTTYEFAGLQYIRNWPIGCQNGSTFFQNVMYKNGSCDSYEFQIDVARTELRAGELLETCRIRPPADRDLDGVDDQGNPIRLSTRNLPAPQTDGYEVLQYTNWVRWDDFDGPANPWSKTGDLSEAIWVDDTRDSEGPFGFIRSTQISGGRTPSMNGTWKYLGDHNTQTAPFNSAQGAVMIGDKFHQMTFDHGTGACTRYEGHYVLEDGDHNLVIDDIGDAGNGGVGTTCPQMMLSPGGLSPEREAHPNSYTRWVYKDAFWEAMASDGEAYMRHQTLVDGVPCYRGNDPVPGADCTGWGDAGKWRPVGNVDGSVVGGQGGFVYDKYVVNQDR